MTTVHVTMTTSNRNIARGLPGEIEVLLRDFRGNRPAKQLFWELLGYDSHDEHISFSDSMSGFRHSVVDARWFASHGQFHVYLLTLIDEALNRRVLRSICRYFQKQHSHFTVLASNAGQTDWQLAYLIDGFQAGDGFRARKRSVRLARMRLGHADENPRRQSQALAKLRAYDDEGDPIAIVELMAAYDEVFLSLSTFAEKSRRSVTGIDSLIEEMGRYPLLTARQERALLVELEQVTHQESIQQGTTKKTIRVPVEGQERRYLEVRDKLILHNLRLCFYVAKKYAMNQEELLDLFQEGVIGMHRAIDLVDPGRMLRFSTYAFQWIRQAVCRYTRQTRRVIRIPVHLQELPKEQRPHHQFISLEEATDLVDPSAPPPSLQREWLERNLLIGLSLQRLPGRHAAILIRRFGLYGGSEATLSEIGESMGVTRERIRQIESRALEELRVRLAPLKEALE